METILAYPTRKHASATRAAATGLLHVEPNQAEVCPGPILTARQVAVTVLRDLLPPGVDVLWFSEFSALTEPLGMNERALRTTLFRLAQQGVVQGIRIGKRSAYRLAIAPDWQRSPDKEAAWSGAWCVAIRLRGRAPPARRAACEANLVAAGFRPVAAGVLLRPQFGACPVHAILERHRMQDATLVLTAEQPPTPGNRSVLDMVSDCWQLGPLMSDYQELSRRCEEFLACPMSNHLSGGAEGEFVKGALLLHEWQTLLSRDPALPAQLLPAQWPKEQAAALIGELRSRVAQGAFVRGVLAPARNRRPPSSGAGLSG
ncbi:PaaX family transcriptional regulator C-terminal domain-containing protein [Massilia cavernae]|nr:PaaX family transcriptional regulator C-terminal domain-containing protein [Massilia cavernae]